MTYSEFQREFATRGYIETPLTESEFKECAARFEDSQYIVSVGLDVGCGFEFHEAFNVAECAQESDAIGESGQ